MFSINKWKTNEASSADGWMKSSSFWWAAGWWLPAAPSSGISFYGELNRASTHVFLERLALTFRLIITHNPNPTTHSLVFFFFSFSLSHTPESRHFSRFVLIFKHFSASQKKKPSQMEIFTFLVWSRLTKFTCWSLSSTDTGCQLWNLLIIVHRKCSLWGWVLCINTTDVSEKARDMIGQLSLYDTSSGPTGSVIFFIYLSPPCG